MKSAGILTSYFICTLQGNLKIVHGIPLAMDESNLLTRHYGGGDRSKLADTQPYISLLWQAFFSTKFESTFDLAW